MTITTCGSSIDTVLAVYTGTTFASLHQEASNDNDTTRCGAGSVTSRVVLDAQDDTDYRIAVGGRDGAEGSFSLVVDPPGNDDVEDAITLTGARVSTEGSLYAATYQSADVDRYGQGSVWYRWTPAESGVAKIDTCGSATYAVPRIYSAGGTHLATGEGLAGCGSGYAISRNVTAGTTYLISVDGGYSYYSSNFVLRINAPAHDLFSDPQQLTGVDDSVSADTTGASKDAYEPVPENRTAVHSLWYTWTPSEQGVVTLSTCGSSIAAEPVVYENYYSSISYLYATTSVTSACTGGATGREVIFNVVVGRTYRIAVDAPGGVTGAFTMSLHQAFDVQAPHTELTSKPNTFHGSSTATFAFSADEPGVAFTCTVDGADSPCASPYIVNGLSQASHTFSVKGVDVAGNAETTGASVTFTVDTDPPDTTLSGPESIDSGAYATLGMTSSEALGGFECSIDGGSFFGCSSQSQLGPLMAGAHTILVRAYDRAGNRDASPATKTVNADRTAPVVAITGGPDGVVADASPTFTFTIDDATATASCDVDGQGGACTSPYTFNSINDGPHQFRVVVTDPVGNTATATRDFVVDTIAPDTDIVPQQASPTKDRTPSFALMSTEAGVTFHCAVDGGTAALCSSPWTVPTDLDDGSHTVTAYATDLGGTDDATSASATFVVDTTAPETIAEAGGPGDRSTTTA